MGQELVIAFHGIGSPPEHVPPEERPYWMPESDFREFIDQAQAEADAVGIQILATFDDGNRSDLCIAAPKLADCGLRGIFFPCSGRFGRSGYLSREDVRTLAAEGFEIGSHGIEHVPWMGLGPEALTREVAESRATIEEAAGRPITSAALPFGAYDAATLKTLRQSGYDRVYSSDPGMSPSDAWFRRRWSYRNDRPFDIRSMARVSRSLRHRLVSQCKHMIKSHR